ncbi:unnamed protein product [Mytilus coruscus]|uniref:Helitron helicase-like domain-containing protein n=1 Tax=Mytilus coruscus TaxID=42192 RepID=A0A6J8D9A2_MYTCO|nr:unnamed protein product [Mytilus coruscus]
MKNIRGTVAYWADVLQNLLATVKSLGPPTLFLTLSADDCSWPELKMLLTEEKEPDLYFLVNRLQIHHHTNSCKRNNACRFGFPKLPSTQTKILANVNITSPSNQGHFYQTKRSLNYQYVNAYNPDLLMKWRANMDIQMVSGVHGLAYYACSYIAKAEPDDLKHALSKIYEDINSSLHQYTAKKQMHLIGNCILKTRRLSAQEAAARVEHLQLIWSSRTTVFLNTRPKEERFKVLLLKQLRNQLPDNRHFLLKYNRLLH